MFRNVRVSRNPRGSRILCHIDSRDNPSFAIRARDFTETVNFIDFHVFSKVKYILKPLNIRCEILWVIEILRFSTVAMISQN